MANVPLVIGIGRPDGGDDAVGLLVAARLRAMGVDATSVTDGAALADALAGAERAVIIDAVATNGPAGEVLHLRGDEIVARAGAVPVSSHGLSVADAVALARALGGATELDLIGVAIEPKALSPASLSASCPSLTPSQEVADAVERAAERARALVVERTGKAGSKS